MSDAAASAQDNAASGTNAEGVAGTGSSDKKSSDQDMVPRARLDAVLERERRLETDLAELRGRVDGMTAQGANGGGEKTYSRAELRTMVEDDKISESEAETIWADQQEQRLERVIEDRVTAALTDHDKRTTATTQIDKYAEALPDVLVEGTDTRTKYASELRYLGSLGHDTQKPETILIAMRTAFGPIERLAMNPGSGRRETMQDTTTAGDGGEGGKEADGKTPRWPAHFDQAQRDYFQKQIDNGYYKDRADCIERVTKTSDAALKRGAARRKVAA